MKHGLRIAVILLLMVSGSCSLFYPPYFYEKIVGSGNSNPENWPAIYVSKSLGNDTNSGTNASEPLQNIQTAVDRSTEYGFSGVKILIHAQYYNDIYSYSNGLSVSSNSNLVISRNKVLIEGGYSDGFSNLIAANAPLLTWPSAITGPSTIVVKNADNVIMRNINIGNQMGEGEGSALYIVNSPNTQLQGVQITSCIGGLSAVYIGNNSSVIMDNAQFNYNGISPIAISNENGNVQIKNCSFSQNSIYNSSLPACIDIRAALSVTISGCIFCNNQNTINPLSGSIHFQSACKYALLENCFFSGNSSTNLLSVYPNAKAELKNNLFDIANTRALMTYIASDSTAAAEIMNIVKFNETNLSGYYISCDNNRATNSYYPGVLCVSPSYSSDPASCSGSYTYPLPTIQDAFKFAKYYTFHEIRLSEGTYYNGYGLNTSESSALLRLTAMTNLTIYGGYDSTFSYQNSYTVIDGQWTFPSVLVLDNCAGIYLNRLELTRSMSPSSSSEVCGLRILRGSNTTLSLCSFTLNSNLNTSGYPGGGASISDSENIYFDTCTFLSNYSALYGGGAYFVNCGSISFVSGISAYNDANEGSAFYFSSVRSFYMDTHFFYSNSGYYATLKILPSAQTASYQLFNNRFTDNSNYQNEGAVVEFKQFPSPASYLTLSGNAFTNTMNMACTAFFDNNESVRLSNYIMNNNSFTGFTNYFMYTYSENTKISDISWMTDTAQNLAAEATGNTAY